MEITDFISSSLGYTFVIGSIIIFYIWSITKIPDYWKEKGVPRVKPVRFFGAVLENIRKPLHENELERYRTLGPIYGYHYGSKKMLSIGDPDVIRDILVKDFQYFTDRRDVGAGEGNTISELMLQMLKGEEWKRVRTIVTPTFTSGKIKRMMHIFKTCSKVLIQNFKAVSEKGEFVDAKSLYGAFTMDVIASSAFSTKLDSHNDPENKFVQTAGNVFQKNISWRIILYQLFPRILKFLNFEYYPTDDVQFFKDVTLQIINERKRTGQKGNDFLQLLIDTTEEKRDELESSDKKDDILSNYGSETNDQVFKNYVVKKSLSFDELVAQCVIFFLAGYETTASTLSFITYQLALNQDIQEKLIKELDETIKKYDGKLTYEAIQNMKYLDNVISESLRISPPSVRLQRLAVMDYKLKGTDIIIPKGTEVTIPVYALQRDEKYWPDPENFDPDRFTAEEKAKRNPYAYIPFGYGPRVCVGMRFALVEIKVCLAYVLSHFRIERCPETKVPLKFHINQILLCPEEIFVRLVKRTDLSLDE